MKERFQFFFSNLISAKRKSFLFHLLKPFLHPISWVYGSVIFFRNMAYERKYIGCYHSPVPLVISIGNIVAGGTGKTPVTLMLLKEFYPDIPVAILSRGYKSPAEKKEESTFLCAGEGPLFPAHECGDEPYLIAKRYPKSFVFVGKNRSASARMAFQSGSQVIILDDGLQHRRVARDFDILVMHADDPFGQGYYLPRGLLRESPSALARASIIILNHIKNQEQFDSLKKKLKTFTNAPVIGTSMKVEKIIDSKEMTLSNLSGKSVGIFCGIAHPEQFKTTINELEANIVAFKKFSDHRTFSEEDLVEYAQQCKELGAEMLVCTEKDFVKLNVSWELCIPLVFLQMELKIIFGETEWKNFMNIAKLKLKNE